jgi:hypothetical protein
MPEIGLARTLLGEAEQLFDRLTQMVTFLLGELSLDLLNSRVVPLDRGVFRSPHLTRAPHVTRERATSRSSAVVDV